MLDPAELDALDEWRFDMRMPSRAAAMRALMRLGLKLDLERDDLKVDPRTIASGNIGIVEGAPIEPDALSEAIAAMPLDPGTARLARELAEVRDISPSDAIREACEMALVAWKEQPGVRTGRLRVVASEDPAPLSAATPRRAK